MDFTGRTALVTGAASGIGAATAALLKERGARVIGVDREAGGHVTDVGDVTDEALWDRLDLAGLDLALVNAGIGAGAPIVELAFAEWRRILSVNLDGAFLTLRAAMQAMAGRPGAIVLTASAAGIKAEPGIAAYGASKAAAIHLARIAAKEGAAQGLRVNAIAPGGVETPIWRQMPQLAAMMEQQGEAAVLRAMAKASTPLGRYAKAEEIAGQIAFLLSDAAATITGAVLTSDGGYTL